MFNLFSMSAVIKKMGIGYADVYVCIRPINQNIKVSGIDFKETLFK